MLTERLHKRSILKLKGRALYDSSIGKLKSPCFFLEFFVPRDCEIQDNFNIHDYLSFY